MISRFLLFGFVLIAITAEGAQMSIPAGSFRPLFAKPKEASQIVNAFAMDITAVTNAQYFKFIKKNPQWSREKIIPLYADKNYLAQWVVTANNNSAPRDVDNNTPVVQVSWYAARAYCNAQGMRLASTAEWEFAAMADERSADARRDKDFQSKILNWYSTAQTAQLAEVGKSPANIYGIQDLHGLVWEWTADFNSVLSTGESRDDAANDNQFFCGGGAIGAANPAEYASFMRYALRASLQARYTLANLGFRCVK